jgi:hypothetical protein
MSISPRWVLTRIRLDFQTVSLTTTAVIPTSQISNGAQAHSVSGNLMHISIIYSFCFGGSTARQTVFGNYGRGRCWCEECCSEGFGIKGRGSHILSKIPVE